MEDALASLLVYKMPCVKQGNFIFCFHGLLFGHLCMEFQTSISV